MKERSEICLLYETVGKNSCSCDKLMSCVWMIVAHFAVTAVGIEGYYTIKFIPRFSNSTHVTSFFLNRLVKQD